MGRIGKAIHKHYKTPLTLLVILVLWQGVVMLFGISEKILPSPLSALAHLLFEQPDANYQWARHISTTLYEVFISFVVTAVLGVVIAVLITWFGIMKRIMLPAFVFLNSLPIIAIAPIILIWFGYGFLTNVLIAFLISFFPVVINATRGLTEVDEDLLDLVHYLNASKWQVMMKIRLPNALPYIFAGMKVSATLVVVGAIVGEFIASDRGLGYIIINAQYSMDTAPIFSSLIVISIIGIALFGLVSIGEKYLMPWKREFKTLK